MANIIDYLKWRGDITFEQVKLNEMVAIFKSLFHCLARIGIYVVTQPTASVSYKFGVALFSLLLSRAGEEKR